MKKRSVSQIETASAGSSGVTIKKEFRLRGLGCASCAAKIEDKVRKLSGVNDSSVNFMTTKLIIEADESRMPEIIKSTMSIIKKIEPDVVMEPQRGG